MRRGETVIVGTRGLICLCLALLLVGGWLQVSAGQVRAQVLMNVTVLSWELIGIDRNNPTSGPDGSIVQARVTNDGDEPLTNVQATFQWTSQNAYVRLSPYETLTKSVGDLAPGEHVDLFWVVEIDQDANALDTTRSLTINASSDQTSASTGQTLTVEGLASQSQDATQIVSVPAEVQLGEVFVVTTEASDTRTIAHISLPLLFDRDLFELVGVRVDYYLSSDFSGGIDLTEYDIYHTNSQSIPHKAARAFYTLRSVRPGTGTFGSLQMDAPANLSSIHYNINLWADSTTVVSSNPDLDISIVDSPDPVPAGSNITYDISYGNVGNTDGTNVIMTDFIPAGTTYVSGSVSAEAGVAVEFFDGASWAATEPATVVALRWIIGTLTVEASGQAGFQVLVDSGTPDGTFIEDSATISSDEVSSTDGAVTTVGSGPSPTISKVDSIDPVEAGAPLTYTITYGNTGNSQDLTGVAVTDYIPADTEYLSGTAFGPSGATIEFFDGASWSSTEPSSVVAVRWIVGTLPDGTSGQQAGFDVIVSPEVAGGSYVENTATITCDQTPQQAVGITTLINQPPVAVDDAYAVDENSTLSVAAPGVLGNDTDDDSVALTAELVSDVSNGTLVLDSDGSFVYTPDLDFTGTDTFTYKTSDGSAESNVATVTITVNPAANTPPVAVNDFYSVDEDNTLNTDAPGVLANDSDADSDPLTAGLVSGPSHGTLDLSEDGSFTYTPDPEFSGLDSFNYAANDGSVDSNTATVTITVNAVNDAPVAVDDAYAMDQDTVLSIDAPGVLENDFDRDEDILSAVLATGVSHGSLTFNSDGSFTYTPEPGWSGIDVFTYRASDGILENGYLAANLTAQSNTATVTITVTPTGGPPVPPARPMPSLPGGLAGLSCVLAVSAAGYFVRRKFAGAP